MQTPLDDMYDDAQTVYIELYRETARLATDNIRLATAVKRLLDAVIFDATPMDERIWVQDMREVATALQELEGLVQSATPATQEAADGNA